MATTPEIANLLGTAGTWELDSDRSSIAFRSTSLWGLVKVKGRFTGLSGGGDIAADGSLSGKLVIDATSVTTGNKKRDADLRADTFFKASSHPQITFQASGVTPLGTDGAKVTGILTITDTSQPLEFEAKVEELDDTGATLSARVDIDRSVWGVSSRRMGMTNMSTPVEVVARFRRVDGT
jgi:polyisoprenoid-binding protein YceI